MNVHCGKAENVPPTQGRGILSPKAFSGKKKLDLIRGRIPPGDFSRVGKRRKNKIFQLLRTEEA